MKNLKKKIFTLLIIALCLPAIALAQPAQPAAAGQTSMFDRISGSVTTYVNQAYGGGSKVQVNTTTFLSSLMLIINYLLTFVGMAFLIGVIYAGFLWMTAKGNEEQLNKAKEMLKQFIIGLIIILSARIITELVLIYIGQVTA